MSDNTILSAALDYRRRGFSIIGLSMATKKPSHKWKEFQQSPMSEAEVRRLFRNGKLGIAVIFGEVSGGLVSRDFDSMPAYEAWAADHPRLATTLPTVETRRGRHVYGRTTREELDEVRRRLGKAGTGAIGCGDGELRAGVGSYSAVPPSRHPSGHEYRWLIPLPEGLLPRIDLLASGFVPDSMLATESGGEHGGLPKNTEAMKKGGVKGDLDECRCLFQGKGEAVEPQSLTGSVLSVPLCRPDLQEQIDLAICESLPTRPGKRNEQVFALARALKAIPTLADADAKDLRQIVKRWHGLALPVIATKPFEESWIDFLRGWPKVKFPAGTEPIAKLFEAALQAPVPTAALEYEQPALRLLVALCFQLQHAAGAQPFYLSCRTAGRLLGVDHSTAARWLYLLVQDGALEEAAKGSQASKRATRYRYLTIGK